MRKAGLLTGVAMAALIAGAPGAFAQSKADIADGGNITQTTTSDVIVSNSGSVSAGNVSGDGASVSSSATGALSSVSGSFIGASISIDIGSVKQTTSQTPATANDPTPEIGNSATVEVGNISGAGAAVQKSATAAVSAVSAAYINSSGDVSVDAVTQTTTANTSRRVENSRPIDAKDTTISGVGASLSASATGAASAVSVSGITDGVGAKLGDVKIGEIKQTTTSDAQVQQKTSVTGNADGGLRKVSGDGASAALSATGAQAAVSVVRIGGPGGLTKTDIGKITQKTTNEGAAAGVSQTGVFVDKFDDTGGLDGGITGDGASVSASATGAVSAVSISSIDTAGASNVSIAKSSRIRQETTNTGPDGFEPSVTNTSEILGSGPISGVGASASISASGATSAVSVASIKGSEVSIKTGDITQISTNSGAVTTTGTIAVGNVTGDAASASISGAGATSAVSMASVGDNKAPSISTGNITQATTNSGAVSNTGTLSAGNLTGAGASASVSATGAASAVSVSVIK